MTSVAAPRRPLPNHILGMSLLVATEVMFFAGLVSALLVARANATVWSITDQPRLPVSRTALNTVLLLLSGLTLREALRMAAAGVPWRGGVARWVGATGALGVLFVALQGREWVRLIGYGITATTSLASGFFYLIVGAHAVHAVAGLGLLAAAALRARQGRLLEAAGIYWGFVVLLWPVLYVLVYLA